MSENELIKKRFLDLKDRAERGFYFTYSDFLGLPEQSALHEVLGAHGEKSCKLWGGVEGAERVIARFGSEEEIGYDAPFPIVCLKAEPKSQKFADRLTHRDFLGALMNLGIEREVLGDIIILDNVGYIFVKEEMSGFLCSELTKVKHTDLLLSIAEKLPEGELYRTERKKIQISSERLDAVVAKVFCLSREAAQSLFKRRLIFVDGVLCESTSYQPKTNQKISVRGEGKFIYLGYDSLSKKGKLNVSVDLYV